MRLDRPISNGARSSSAACRVLLLAAGASSVIAPSSTPLFGFSSSSISRRCCHVLGSLFSKMYSAQNFYHFHSDQGSTCASPRRSMILVRTKFVERKQIGRRKTKRQFSSPRDREKVG
ncbi:hypothetical protein OPV22_018978 [Ensete ventricosum]|uniref:Secreted protein n=1 Tax=Ensete ventricosum TaxID=4639 RepID=A0AAV8R0T3_ENSVE|nr:hypothetical protein OPV22_018978 [Ensete ventricosum]